METVILELSSCRQCGRQVDAAMSNRIIAWSEDFRIIRPKILTHGKLVRLGDNWDGGYLVPSETIKNINRLVSYGLGNNFSFEGSLSKLNPQMRISIYDHTVNIKTMIKDVIRSIVLLRDFKDIHFRLSQVKGNVIFLCTYLILFRFNAKCIHRRAEVMANPTNPSQVSIRDTLWPQVPGTFLKMDIEGGEYSTLRDVMENSDQLIGLCIEFHDIVERKLEFLRLIELLCQEFSIVHFHINNAGKVVDGIPDILEMTFIRSRECSNNSISYPLPIVGLDFPNSPRKDDFNVVF